MLDRPHKRLISVPSDTDNTVRPDVCFAECPAGGYCAQSVLAELSAFRSPLRFGVGARVACLTAGPDGTGPGSRLGGADDSSEPPGCLLTSVHTVKLRRYTYMDKIMYVIYVLVRTPMDVFIRGYNTLTLCSATVLFHSLCVA
jgi:hypothetical protein